MARLTPQNLPTKDGTPSPAAAELEAALFRALRKAILLALGLYTLIQFLESVTFLVLFFALVFLVAAVLNPVVAWLQRRRIPRPLSAAVLGLLVVGAIAGALAFALPPLLEEGQELARRAPQLWNGLRNRIEELLASQPGLAGSVPTSEELIKRAGPYASRLAGRLGQYTLNAVSLLVSLVLLVVLVVYSLASPQPLVAGLLGAVSPRHRPKAERILELILARLKAWALGSLLLGAIVGVMTGIGLFFLKVPFALVFAVVAGIGELLPNLGPLLSAIPPVLVALAIDPMMALWVAVLFVVVQQLENNIIVPLVMSRTLDLHPLSVTFMVLVMGTMFGLLGAVIAVPATVILKTLYQELYLAGQVSDPGELEAQSDRIVSDEAMADTEEATATAPASAERRRKSGA